MGALTRKLPEEELVAHELTTNPAGLVNCTQPVMMFKSCQPCHLIGSSKQFG